jgi:N12 class adenine-specific DNA methylase
MAYDYAAARKSGVLDSDIISSLAARHKFDLRGARAAGVPDGDILSSLLERENRGEIARAVLAPSGGVDVPADFAEGMAVNQNQDKPVIPVTSNRALTYAMEQRPALANHPWVRQNIENQKAADAMQFEARMDDHEYTGRGVLESAASAVRRMGLTAQSLGINAARAVLPKSMAESSIGQEMAAIKAQQDQYGEIYGMSKSLRESAGGKILSGVEQAPANIAGLLTMGPWGYPLFAGLSTYGEYKWQAEDAIRKAEEQLRRPLTDAEKGSVRDHYSGVEAVMGGATEAVFEKLDTMFGVFSKIMPKQGRKAAVKALAEALQDPAKIRPVLSTVTDTLKGLGWEAFSEGMLQSGPQAALGRGLDIQTEKFLGVRLGDETVPQAYLKGAEEGALAAVGMWGVGAPLSVPSEYSNRKLQQQVSRVINDPAAPVPVKLQAVELVRQRVGEIDKQVADEWAGKIIDGLADHKVRQARTDGARGTGRPAAADTAGASGDMSQAEYELLQAQQAANAEPEPEGILARAARSLNPYQQFAANPYAPPEQQPVVPEQQARSGLTFSDTQTSAGAALAARDSAPTAAAGPVAPVVPVSAGQQGVSPAVAVSSPQTAGEMILPEAEQGQAKEALNEVGSIEGLEGTDDATGAQAAAREAGAGAGGGQPAAGDQGPTVGAAGAPTTETGAKVAFNEQRQGIELTFPGRPSDEVIAGLKDAGFRFSSKQKLWYAKDTPERRAFVENILTEDRNKNREIPNNGAGDILPGMQTRGPGQVDGVGVAVSDLQEEMAGVGSDNRESGVAASPQSPVTDKENTDGLSEMQQEVGGSQEEVPAVRGAAVEVKPPSPSQLRKEKIRANRIGKLQEKLDQGTLPTVERDELNKLTAQARPKLETTVNLPKDFGAVNKLFTKDKADKAREILRAKLGQLNAGIDPEMVTAGIDIAGYYIEGGFRTFKAYSAKMVEDLGEAVKPFLKSFYLAVRNYPGFDGKGMNTEAEIDSLEELEKVEKAAALPRKVPKGLGNKTLRGDYGVKRIDAYSPAGERAKEVFLKDAKAYLKDVAAVLVENGYTAEKVTVNEGGEAGSGDVHLVAFKDGSEYGTYVTIGGSAMSFGGASPSGVQIMYRANTRTSKYNGMVNRWDAPWDMSSRRLAELMMKETDQQEAQAARKAAAKPLVGDNKNDIMKPQDEKGGSSDDDTRDGGNSPSGVERSRPRGVRGAEEGRGSGERDGGQRHADADGDANPDERGRNRSGSVGGQPAPVRVQEPGDAEGSVFRPALPVEATPASEPRGLKRAGDNPGNYRITAADNIGGGSRSEKIANNLAAIRLIKQLDRENRYPTRDEQAVLVKYVGWGGLKSVFDPTSSRAIDNKTHAELEQILTKEELFEMRQSVLNAHYTSPEVIGSIYSILEHMGFVGGNVLEPTYGAGNFIGLMPERMAAGSKWYGSELDLITSKIGQYLYPDAQLLQTGFQHAEFPYGKFDLAIGNPPFGSERITDTNQKRSEINGFKIHNYVIAKSGMHLRPGGVLAMVVTSRFLDTADAEARDYLSRHFKFLTAIRLPNDAFAKNAGTEVTTDLVFFQKLMPGESPDATNRTWLETGATMTNAAGEEVSLNRWFVEHSELMLGEPSMQGTMYGGRWKEGGEFTLNARPGQDTAAEITRAIADDQGLKDIFKPTPQMIAAAATAIVMNREDVGIGGYVQENGKTFIRQDDDEQGNPVFVELTAETPWTEKQSLGETRLQRIKGMLGLRQAAYDLINAERFDDPSMEQKRSELNRLYDAFVSKYGFLTDTANASLMADDVKIESGLEVNYRKAITAAKAKALGTKAQPAKADKAAIFKQRVFFPTKEITTASSVRDGYNVSLSEKGRLDLDYIASLTKKSVDEVTEDLAGEGLIFRDPETGEWIQEDDYLSGNVKAKLAKVQGRDGFEKNVEALKKVLPADVPADEIFVDLGATWVPVEVYREFAELLGMQKPRVMVLPETGTVKVVSTAGQVRNEINVLLQNDDYGVMTLFNAIANKQSVVAYDHVDDGNGGTKRVVNRDRTKALVPIVKRVSATFRDWIMSDPIRADKLARLYNETQNTHAPRLYNGKHLKTVGASPAVRLRNSQRNAAWRMTQSQVTLLDHVVGAGKTFTIITGVMERRRLGLSNKPMIVVPNHLVGQWAADFLKLYPAARILAATKKDFEKKNRRRLFARIATGDFDAVIVGHSSFGFIPIERDTHREILMEEISYLERALYVAKESEDKRSVRNITERIAKKREKISDLMERPTDDVITFESMGVDMLVVDESHEFKNLEYSTAMQNITGMGNPAGAKKSFDLYAKIQYLRGKGGAVGFATGTPISNSLVEMYTILRYLNRQGLKDRQIDVFDAWAKTYALIETVVEYTASQKLKERQVMSTFDNLPSMLQLYTEFADVISMKDLKRIYAEQIREENQRTGKSEREEFPVPKVKNGGRWLDVADPTPAQREYMQYLIARADRLEKLGGQNDPKTDNSLWLMNDARKMALDIRLVDPAAADDPGNKVNRAAGRIKEIYDRWSKDKGTQMVFCDLSTPSKGADKSAGKFIKGVLDLLGLEKDKRIAAILESLDFAGQWDFLKNKIEMEVDRLGGAAQSDENDHQRERLEKFLEQVGDEEISLLHTADSGFSVYDDLKKKLVAAGIPENEIAFIHDANNDNQKQELFARMNSGDVRVLLGSSKKMGAGTNAQERLVALHHMDAPWRPSDVEQREGRIIRQGNILYERDPDNFEVEIVAYSTRQTFDAVMWQILARKAGMLDDFRSGTRKITEEAGDSVSYSEFMAESTGNPIFREKFTLEREIEELESTQRNIFSRRQASERIVKDAERLTAEREQAVELARRDYDEVKDATQWEVAGRRYADDLDDAYNKALDQWRQEAHLYERELLPAWLATKTEVENRLAAGEIDDDQAKEMIPKKPAYPGKPSLVRLAKNSQAAQAAKAVQDLLNDIPAGESVEFAFGGAQIVIEKTPAAADRFTFRTSVNGNSMQGLTSTGQHMSDSKLLSLFSTGGIKAESAKRLAFAKEDLERLQENIKSARLTLKKLTFEDAPRLEKMRERYAKVVEEVNGLEKGLAEEREKSGNVYMARDSRRFGTTDDTGDARPKTQFSLKSDAAAPFYSLLERVVESKMGGKMPVDQLRRMLKSNGVTDAEMEQLLGGLQGTVTKQQVLDEIRANSVEFEDVVLGTESKERLWEAPYEWGNDLQLPLEQWRKEIPEDEKEAKQTTYYDMFKGSDYYWDEENPSWKEYRESLLDELKHNPDAGSVPTHFSQYTEPGAKEGSYREMFVTAPGPHHTRLEEDPEFDVLVTWSDGHSEYSEIQNPIVRIRFNERESGGQRVLFVEEMQGPSDANQQKMPEYLRKRIYDIGVKRVLAYAKENGFDGVAWTTGEMQAKRYDLSKHISSVEAYANSDGSYNVFANDRSGWLVVDKRNVPEQGLEGLVGKDLAAKIISQPLKRGEYSGLDLKVGGEGLKRLYDQTLPALFKKYGKEGVEQVAIGEKTSRPTVKSGFQTRDEAEQWRTNAGDENSVVRLNRETGSYDVINPEASTEDISVPYIPVTDKTPAAYTRFSTDADTVSFTGLQADDVRKEFAAVPFSQGIEVLQTVAEIPAPVKADARRERIRLDQVEAFVHDGKVWLVAENLQTMSRARVLALGHELAHRGQTERLLDASEKWFRETEDKQDSQWRQIAHQILQQVAADRKLSLKNKEHYRLAVAEATARMAEDAVKQGVKPGLIHRLAVYIKDVLRRAGITVKFTDQELAGAIGEMLRIGEKRLGEVARGSEVAKNGYSLRSRLQQAVDTVPWAEVLNTSRENWLRLINPLDWSRGFRVLQDISPDFVKDALGWFFMNPVFQAERDPAKRRFVEAGEDREINRMEIILDFLGYQPGEADNRSMGKKALDFFTKWQASTNSTDWEKMNQRFFDLSERQKKALDAIFVEGDAMGSEYASLAQARMNPRLARLDSLDRQVFSLYRDIRRHIDYTVKEARIRHMESMMREIHEMSDQEREQHIADYRNQLRDVRGWLTRDHGEGRHQVAVYHEFTAGEMAEDWVGKVLFDRDDEVAGHQYFLPYYPGNDVMGIIEQRVKEGWAEAKGKVTTTAKGHVVITVKGDAENAIEDINDAIAEGMEGKRIRVMSYMRRFQTRAGAEAHAKTVEADYAKAMPRNYIEGRRYVTKTRVADGLTEDMFQAMKSDMALEAALKESLKNAFKRGEIDKEKFESLNDQLVQDTAEVLLSRAAGRYQIRRAPYLIEGYETQGVMSLYQDYMMGVAGMLSKAKYAMIQYRHLRNAGAEEKPWAVKYVFDSLRNMGAADRASGDFRALLSLWFMGMKLSSAFINATQPYTLGYAELGRRIGPGKSPMKLILQAQRDIIGGKSPRVNNTLTDAGWVSTRVGSGLSSDERQIFDSAIYKHQEMSTALGELSGHNEGTYTKAGRLLHGLTGKALALFQNIEVLNRKGMILAAYRAFRSDALPAGVLDSDALARAMELNGKVNFEMGRHNLPGWARGTVGRTAYALQSFTWNSLNWIFNRLTSGEKRDMVALLRYAGMIALLGGAAALPGGDELDKLYRKLRGRSLKLDLEVWSKKAARKFGTLGEMVNAFAWHGLLSAGGAGVNASNAIRLQIPVVSQMLADSSALEAVSGVPGAMVGKAGAAARYLQRGDKGKALEAISPEAVAGPLRAVRQYRQGMTTSHGKPVFDEHGRPLKYSAADAIKRGLGFQPYGQSKRAEQTEQMRSIRAHWNEERKDLMDELRAAGDKQRGKVIGKIADFNRDLAKSQAAGIVDHIKGSAIRRGLTFKPNKDEIVWRRQHSN